MRALVAIALGLLLCAPASAQRRDQRYRERTPRLVAHEWGVFVLEHGRVAHLDELGAELPAFVHRGQAPAVVTPGPMPIPPRPPPGTTVARKPVLFLYASQDMQVHVEVGFDGGAPWFHYPSASARPAGLAWDVRVVPRAAAPLAQPQAGHFWLDLRSAGGDLILAPDGTAERFVFYDGEVAFRRPFLIGQSGAGAAVTPASGGDERLLFLVDGGLYSEADVDARTWSATPRGTGDMQALRARLDAELRARGLTAGESLALLETWRDDLFTDRRRRAVYFVSRESYDGMLPIRIVPQPAELVRVGLVIDRY